MCMARGRQPHSPQAPMVLEVQLTRPRFSINIENSGVDSLIPLAEHHRQRHQTLSDFHYDADFNNQDVATPPPDFSSPIQCERSNPSEK